MTCAWLDLQAVRSTNSPPSTAAKRKRTTPSSLRRIDPLRLRGSVVEIGLRFTVSVRPMASVALQVDQLLLSGLVQPAEHVLVAATVTVAKQNAVVMSTSLACEGRRLPRDDHFPVVGATASAPWALHPKYRVLVGGVGLVHVRYGLSNMSTIHPQLCSPPLWITTFRPKVPKRPVPLLHVLLSWCTFWLHVHQSGPYLRRACGWQGMVWIGEPDVAAVRARSCP